MQDSYVGDIGDYGKYGLLRKVNSTGLKLAVNWYKVVPKQIGKQNDGKYVSYLLDTQRYRHYDTALFDELNQIVNLEQSRSITRVERSELFEAIFYSEPLLSNRKAWHQNALKETSNADIVFLDPDNGLETERMHRNNEFTEKHVCWNEIRDYYDRGQSVILYQHRPQMMKKEICIRNVMDFQTNYLKADDVQVLEFPRYTNRFYFFFTHKKISDKIQSVCEQMASEWKGLCNKIDLNI